MAVTCDERVWDTRIRPTAAVNTNGLQLLMASPVPFAQPPCTIVCATTYCTPKREGYLGKIEGHH